MSETKEKPEVILLEGMIGEWKLYDNGDNQGLMNLPDVNDDLEEVIPAFDLKAGFPWIPGGTPIELVFLGYRGEGNRYVPSDVYGVRFPAQSEFFGKVPDGVYFDRERDDGDASVSSLPESLVSLFPEAKRILYQRT